MPELPDWVRGLALLGKYGADYVTIQTDADGNLFAVLKGDDDGTLRTIALDDEGRMEAIVIDARNAWGLASNIGLSELASRLGGNQRYDTRGTIVWSWGFEDGQPSPWYTSFGGGASGALCAGGSAHGGYCYEITLPGGGPGSGTVQTYISTPTIASLGFEGAFRVNDIRGQLDFKISDQSQDGYKNGGVRVDTFTGKLYYLNSAGGWTEFYDISGDPVTSKTWSRMKLVTDHLTGKYVRFMFNRWQWDMSAYSMQTGVSGAPGRIILEVACRTNSSVNNAHLLDNWILTNFEPE